MPTRTTRWLGQGGHRRPRPGRRRSASGKHPPPRSGPRPSLPPPPLGFAERGEEEVRAADLQCEGRTRTGESLPPRRRGSSCAGRRDRVRDCPSRRSLLRLLSRGRRPHPCPSPVRERGSGGGPRHHHAISAKSASNRSAMASMRIRALRGVIRRSGGLPAAPRIAIQGVESLGDAFDGDLAHFQDRELGV